MRFWAKIGIDVLVIGLVVSLASLAKLAFDPPQFQIQRAIQTFTASNNLGADTASALAAWTADNKNKSGNKDRRGKSGPAKDKPRERTKNAGQRARTDTSDKCLAHGAGTKPTGMLLLS